MPAKRTALRRKRQVEGKRNDVAVKVYVDPAEEKLLRNAAQKQGKSLSGFFAEAAVREARRQLGLNPDTGEPISR